MANQRDALRPNPFRQGFLVCVRPVRESPALKHHRCAGECGRQVIVSLSENDLLKKLPHMEIRCLECAVKHLLSSQDQEQ